MALDPRQRSRLLRRNQTMLMAYAAAFSGGRSSAFTPLNLFAAGEQGVWFDPSDFSTMYQDSAGTTPVTAVGQPVGKINDKSGRGNHATQATAASRPVLQQDGAGKYYLDFDGTDDSLATSSINYGTDKVTIFAGLRKANDTASILCESSVSIINDGTFYLVTGTDDGTTGYTSMSKGTAAAASTLNTRITAVGADLAVISVTHDISGDLSTIRRNGVAGTNATGDKGAGNFTNQPLYIGRRGGSTLPFNGRIYSLIVRGAASTATEITNAETWVNAKTGAF